MAQQLKDIDRLIQTLYASAIEHEWVEFRCYALEQLCKWAGAASAAWLTRSSGDLPGEFSEWPAAAGYQRGAVAGLRFGDGGRELDLDPLPATLVAAPPASGDWAHAVSYTHRGGGLTSAVVLRFARDQRPEAESLHRAVGHVVEAGTLSLRQYIQRDEWLYSLGRPSRGTAALVDARGTIYAASRRFRDLLGGEFGLAELSSLPAMLPEEALQEDDYSFAIGALHFRTARIGSLYLLHARKPLPLDGLSPREQEIARALGNGKTFKSVARQFDIAVSTVANHASRIYKKLGIYRREELVELVRMPPGSTARTTH